AAAPTCTRTVDCSDARAWNRVLAARTERPTSHRLKAAFRGLMERRSSRGSNEARTPITAATGGGYRIPMAINNGKLRLSVNPFHSMGKNRSTTATAPAQSSNVGAVVDQSTLPWASAHGRYPTAML